MMMKWHVNNKGFIDGIPSVLIDGSQEMKAVDRRYLVEAAPLLLEACEMTLRVLLQIDNGEDYVTRTINDLDAAIRAAKGGE